MKSIIRPLALAAAMLVAQPGWADGIVLEANGARAQGRWGGELGVGYNIDAAGFNLRPIIGAFVYRGDNDRYENDTFSNGQSRCRDLRTGQFASSSKCSNVAANAYGKVELTYSIPLGPEIGGGVRFSSERVRPYGTVAFAAAPKLRVQGNLGDRYYALGLSARF